MTDDTAASVPHVLAQLTLADEVYLARFDLETGTLLPKPRGHFSQNEIQAQAAAALIELLDDGNITRGTDDRVTVTDRAPSHPDLLAVWERVQKRRRPKKVRFYFTDVGRAVARPERLQSLGVLEPAPPYNREKQTLSVFGLEVLRASQRAEVVSSILAAAGQNRRDGSASWRMTESLLNARRVGQIESGLTAEPISESARAILFSLYQAAAPS